MALTYRLNTRFQDTYTTAASGTIVVGYNAFKSYSMQVKGTGASPTSWTVSLRGSLDGVNFTTIFQHKNTDGDGVIIFSGATFYPAIFLQTVCDAVVLGSATNIVVDCLAVP